MRLLLAISFSLTLSLSLSFFLYKISKTHLIITIFLLIPYTFFPLRTTTTAISPPTLTPPLPVPPPSPLASVGVMRCPRGPDGTAGFGRGAGGGQLR